MLRVAEHFQDTDLGRQRQGNEDRFFVRSPLFAVADGMGGAQAGEVASEMAVGTLAGGLPDGGAPAERLVRAILEANHRIHERSINERRRAGMGTTITAAYVGEDAVVVAHVGDSRCYLLRDRTLTRLTRDHSLVGELVARGKLTEEQAEAHPQRSVITRALGPEPHVDVDVDVFPARDGDTFLLCSDGLTSMVPEARVTEIVTAGPTLAVAGRALIDAANAAGGRDNITVILFRLEEVGDVGARHSGADERTQEHVLPELETAEHPGRMAVALHDEDQPTAMVPRIEPPDPPHVAVSGGGEGRRRRRRRRVHPGFVLLTIGIILPLLVGGWLATRSVFFLGTDTRDDRTIAIYRGLPYDLPFGIQLYSRYAGSGVTIDQVPARRRATFTDHKLRSRDDAEDLVIALEKGRLE